jgi:PhzF family phenazine biosynthesis protein
MLRPYAEVDVFAESPYTGNPVAVILDGRGLTDGQMQQIASWTNLSETTFVLPPESPEADYRVRIFMPTRELPFAGHPTLGTCHAWLAAGGSPQNAEAIIQECGVGLVPIRRAGSGLAFAAPARIRSGPVEDQLLAKIAEQLRIDRSQIVAAEWADNGPPWIGVMLATAEEVLAVTPGIVDEDIGLIAPASDGAGYAYEVRAFFPKDGVTIEDPVTGSLNASLAQWLVESGQATPPYRVRQGTVLGRTGLVDILADDAGGIWVGGGTITCVSGTIDIPT